MLIPKEFFITSGSAFSEVSELNAFDLALLNAGVEEQNLVAVSSVIPDGATQVEKKTLPMGAITHCVLAQMRGKSGDYISAGIAYAFREDGCGGYVAESHGFGSRTWLEKELKKKVLEIGRIRGVILKEPTIIIEEMKIPEGGYGCCVASLVFSGYK